MTKYLNYSYTPKKLNPPNWTIINGKEVYWGTHHWTGKLVMFLRTPEKHPSELQAEKFAERTKRYDVRLCTQHFPKGISHSRASPTDPHLTWTVRSTPVIGLQPGVVPSTIDLHSPRVGRVFQWQRNGNPYDTIPLVIFPTDPVNPLCPPYPGLCPNELDDISHPRNCFSDGGLGAWDP
jgi:hypothetical protein